MDPVQLMMAAHQADATVAAQTPDQALQAAIAQSRPDLWAPLSTNPAAYPDLLGWLASTGNVEVLANLRARGYLTDDAAASAAGGVGDAGAAAAADSAAGEPTVDPAFSQGDPAQTEPTESAESAGDGGTPVDEDEAADEPGPVDDDEAEDVQATESVAEAATEPDAETATGEAQAPRPDDSGDEAEDDAEDADSGEAGVEPETEESDEDSEGTEGTEDAEAEGPAPEDPHVEDTAADESADERGVEPADEVEDVQAAESVAEAATEPDAEDSAEEATDVDDFGEVGDEQDTDDPAEGSNAAETAAEPDAEPEVADEVAAGANEVREAETVVLEDDASDDVEDSDAAEAAVDPDAEAETATDEAADSDNNDTTVLAPGSQRHEVDSADTTDSTASAQSAAVTSGWTAGSAAPAAGSAESVALPVPPPPSAEDIAAWAETPSGAPSGFSAAQPAVELDMFGPQMMAQMPPPQQQRQPSRSSSGRLIAIIVVLLLVIVGGGGVWAGTYFANKGKSDSSQDKADGNGDKGGEQNGQADAAATSTAAALPSGAVKACSSMPTFTITSVEDGQGELKVQGNMATSCAEGDFLAGASNQVLVYSSTSPTGGEDVDHLVASGTFDLSGDPLIIPNGGRAVTLRFGEQHYFRTAKDLDLKGLSVRPSFDRGSPSSATAKSSTNSPMTIASSTSSNANQEAQDEQAAGEAIQWQVKHDYPLVKERLLHQWTPQLSSKQVGLVADGQTWTNRSILAEYLRIRQDNPNAVIIDTSQWPVYDVNGWWVTLQGERFGEADQANAWCDAQGYDSDHCLAKRIESSGSSQGTTKTR